MTRQMGMKPIEELFTDVCAQQAHAGDAALVLNDR